MTSVVRSPARPTWTRSGRSFPCCRPTTSCAARPTSRAPWIPCWQPISPNAWFRTRHHEHSGPTQGAAAAPDRRVVGGASAARRSGLAVLIGTLVGMSRQLEAWLDPTFQALRAVPGLAWVPLLLIWLGIDEVSKVTLIAIGSFFPVYMNMVAGVRNVDRKLVEVGTQ